MKPPPPSWPRMSASAFYDDPKPAIEWLCRAFGFELRLLVEGDDGTVRHSELTFGEAVVMVGATGNEQPYQRLYRSPSKVGGITQALCFYLDDVDAHYARAVAHGAKTVREPATEDYGDDYWSDRSCGLTDPEGHLWWFIQRMRSPGEPR